MSGPEGALQLPFAGSRTSLCFLYLCGFSSVSNHSAMANTSHHATLWRSFPKHNSLAGGTGRTQVSFSALGNPCSWKQAWTAATAVHAEYTRAPWEKITTNHREVSWGSYHTLCKAERGRHEMGLPIPPVSLVTVTLLTWLKLWLRTSLNRSTLTHSQLCCWFCKALLQHQITLLTCCHTHT